MRNSLRKRLMVATMLLATGCASVFAQDNQDFPVYDFKAEDCIKTQPEGELKVYERNGDNYTSYLGGVVEGIQSGQRLEVVFGDDGKTVWFYNIVSTACDCFSWVKGEIEGNKITIPAGQPMWFLDYGSYYNAYVLCNLAENEDPDATAYETYKCIPGDIELSYENGEIKLLPNQSGIAAIGLQRYSTDSFIIEYGLNYKWLGYGDVGSEYAPFDAVPTKGPSDEIPQLQYAFTYSTAVGGETTGHLVDVAIDGENFYVRGLSQTTSPDSWAKGEIKGGQLVFPAKQYLGIQRVNFADHFIYLCASGTFEEKGELYADFADETIFSWDTASGTATSDGSLMMNSGDSEVVFSDIWFDMKLSPYKDVAAIPANPKIGRDYFSDPDWGMTQIMVEIPCLDVNGNYINTSYLSYRMFVNGEVYTFVPGDFEYFDLEQPMQDIPYNFSSYDIQMLGAGIWSVTFYGDEPKSIGVQSISTAGGETNYSDIITYSTSRVEDMNQEAMPATVKYYDISGVEVPYNTSGLIMRVEKYEDGTIKTTKQINK